MIKDRIDEQQTNMKGNEWVKWKIKKLQLNGHRGEL